MQIRPATPLDAHPLAELHIASWRAAYVGQVPDDYLAGLSVAGREEMWQDILGGSNAGAGGTTLVLTEGGAAGRGDHGTEAIVGFASIAASRDADAGPGVGEVMGIYLAPDHWGQGSGRQLMNEALHRLEGQGFTTATLWVLDTNARAQHFYRAGGWAPDGATKTDDLRGFALHEVRYRRPL
jgi:ribosomal protein S18 acetylase RimI-like enzyme